MSQIFLSSALKKFLETIFIDSTKIYLLEKSLEPIEIRIFLIIIISRNQNLFPSLISSYFNQKSLEFSRLKFQDPSSNLLHFYLHHIINIYIYIYKSTHSLDSISKTSCPFLQSKTGRASNQFALSFALFVSRS